MSDSLVDDDLDQRRIGIREVIVGVRQTPRPANTKAEAATAASAVLPTMWTL